MKKTSKARQDDLARRRRLNQGRCPIHGTPLTQTGVVWEDGAPVADEVGCPRKDCKFTTAARPGTKLFNALHCIGG